jgi:hypothetical protein
LSDLLTQITVLNIERENQGTANKGKLTTSEDSDTLTTQNRKRLMDTWNNKIINQNLQGAHGRIDNRPQCATIDLEAPIAHGAWPSQSLGGRISWEKKKSSVSINAEKTNNAPTYVERFKVPTVLMVMFNM